MMDDYMYSSILIISAFAAGGIAYLIIRFLLGRWSRVISLKGFTVNLKPLNGPLRYLLPILGLIAVTPSLKISKQGHLLMSHFINILLIALFGWLSVKIANIICSGILSRYDIKAKDNVFARGMHTQMRMITNIVNVIIIILTVSFILMTFEQVRHIGVSILASAGIVGIVIGFAAQKTLGNFIAGIQIAIAQPIRLDDVVIIENEWGWIEEITLTFVVVRIWDLRRLVVPISYFLEKPFQNWTRTSANLLGTVFIYTDYTVPVEEIRKELTRILESSPKWDKKVDVLQVTNATDKTVELRALMSAADSPTAWDLRCQVREKLLEFMQQRFPESLPRIRIEMDKGH